MANTPNMNLPDPTVSVTAGPTWATLLNSCFTLIDQHSHISGQGVPITPAGMNITADLTFNSTNSATNLLRTGFTSQSGTLASSILNSAYVVSGDLWYNNSSGTAVQLTSGGSIAAAAGNIGGLGGNSAAITFDGVSTFQFFSANGTDPAQLNGSSILISNTAFAHTLTLQAPTLASNYAITLPALAASNNSFLMFGTAASGVISSSISVDGSTLEAATGTLHVKAKGIAAAQIADTTITGAQIAAATVAKTNLTAVGQQISGSSGAYSMNQSGYHQPTNLSVTITTTGRPVFVGLMPDGSGSNAYVALLNISGTGNLPLQMLRGATQIFYTNLPGGAASTTLSFPPSAFWTIDVVAAGTYTYAVQVKNVGSGSDSILVAYNKLVVYEL